MDILEAEVSSTVLCPVEWRVLDLHHISMTLDDHAELFKSGDPGWFSAFLLVGKAMSELRAECTRLVQMRMRQAKAALAASDVGAAREHAVALVQEGYAPVWELAAQV